MAKFKGDDLHLLPAQQIEPYRLWFEFLKLALTDPTITVSPDFYSAWGDPTSNTFKSWWSSHWRELFAVDIGVSETDPQSVPGKRSDKALYVRIPLYQDPKRSLAQIEVLLTQHGASDRLKDMADGQFRLQVGDGVGSPVHPSTRFLRNLPKVRLLLNLYRFWITHEGSDDRLRLEKTARSYFQWADRWNRQIKEKGWKRTPIEIPTAIAAYVEYLTERGVRKRLPLYESESGDVSDHRRQIARYIRKARKLASNVAEGRFPGDYE